MDRLLDPFLGGLGLRSNSSVPGIALSMPLDLAFAVSGWAAQGHREGRRGWPGPDRGSWSWTRITRKGFL